MIRLDWCRGCLDNRFRSLCSWHGVVLCFDCADYAQACIDYKPHPSCRDLVCTQCDQLAVAAESVKRKARALGQSRTVVLARLMALFIPKPPLRSLPRSLGG